MNEIIDEVQEARKKKKPDAEKQKQTRDRITEQLLKLNESYAILQRGSQVVVMREGFGVDGEPTISYMSTKDFATRVANIRVWDEAEGKYVGVANAWLSWPERREFDGLYFRPDSEDRTRFYNLWRGFKIEPSPTGKCDIILDHIFTNICQGNQHYYEWVMAWLADIFQNPGKKPGTALVLRGEMGIGKGAFANHIGYLLGNHYCTVANSSQVTGRFNSHLAERIMIFVDESFWNGEKGGAGILRALITEPRQPSEMKGRDLVMVDSFLRLIIAANDDWAVPVGMKDERRFTVLDVGTGVQRDKPYFTAMEEELLNGGYAKLLHTFLNYKYDPVIPKDILSTEALFEQKLHSMRGCEKWLYDCLADGVIKTGERTWPYHYILVGDFYDSYSAWCDTTKVRDKLSRNALSRALKKFIVLERKRVHTEGWAYFLDDLENCRQQFAAQIGYEINWHEKKEFDERLDV